MWSYNSNPDIFVFRKMLGTSRVCEKLSVSQDVLGSMESVSQSACLTLMTLSFSVSSVIT
jgi:hypothetical protein